MTIKPFYVVWNPASPRGPTQQFNTYEQASAEAEYMAMCEGGAFYICQVMSGVEAAKNLPLRPIRKINFMGEQ